MKTGLTVQQIAAITGLTAHTLRYYEGVGLIDPIERNASGHRRYTESDLAWIKLLIRLRGTGMTIAHMHEFAALRRQGEATIERWLRLLEEHRVAVAQQIAQLNENVAAIDAKIEIYTIHLQELVES